MSTTFYVYSKPHSHENVGSTVEERRFSLA